MIGIVGGVGPYAGLDLAKNIFDNTMAQTDQDHLPVAILSLSSTILDRTEYLLGEVETNPGMAIADVIVKLDKMGCTLAGIPCNTAHAKDIFYLTKKILDEKSARIKLLSLVDETIKAISSNYPTLKKIGVLSTTGTYQFGIYAEPLRENGLEPITPSEQMQHDVVHPAIYDKTYGIKAQSSPVTERAKEDLLNSVQSLKENGAELIIKGCTEIALAIPEHIVHGIPTIDPSIVLARSLIRDLDPTKLKSIEF